MTACREPETYVTTILMIVVLLLVTKFFGTRSGKYFGMQQRDIASLTGFVQERLSGQRVIKVFNHEHVNKEEFDKYNECLFESASKAQIISSIMAPIVGNLANSQDIYQI